MNAHDGQTPYALVLTVLCTGLAPILLGVIYHRDLTKITGIIITVMSAFRILRMVKPVT